MARTAEYQRRYREALRERGLNAHGRPWKRMPPSIAAQHADTLRDVADLVPLAVAITVHGIADDLEQHAGLTDE